MASTHRKSAYDHLIKMACSIALSLHVLKNQRQCFNALTAFALTYNLRRQLLDESHLKSESWSSVPSVRTNLPLSRYQANLAFSLTIISTVR